MCVDAPVGPRIDDAIPGRFHIEKDMIGLKIMPMKSGEGFPLKCREHT